MVCTGRYMGMRDAYQLGTSLYVIEYIETTNYITCLSAPRSRASRPNLKLIVGLRSTQSCVCPFTLQYDGVEVRMGILVTCNQIS